MSYKHGYVGKKQFGFEKSVFGAIFDSNDHKNNGCFLKSYSFRSNKLKVKFSKQLNRN